MLKRTILFAHPYHLRVEDKQLVAVDRETGKEKRAPVEDLGYVILDHPQISVTLPLLEELNSRNVAVIFCDRKHMPVSMNLNLDGHHLQSELFRYQTQASLPLKKNLWQQTVTAKIRNQAALLEKKGGKYEDLLVMARNVKNGDADNREGAAARLYWLRLFGKDFVRDRYGSPPNNLLNYGYAVLRAAVARALTGSGLLATLGIHHHNRYNAFCLADDIMEPYRPFVDELADMIYREENNPAELSNKIKLRLLELLSRDVTVGKMKRPLMVALSLTSASLAQCFSGETRKLVYARL